MFLSYPPVDRRSGVGHGFVRTGVEFAVLAVRRHPGGRLQFLRQIAAVVAAAVPIARALLVIGVQVGEITNGGKGVAVAVRTVNDDVVVYGCSPQLHPRVAVPTRFDQQTSLLLGTHVLLRSRFFFDECVGGWRVPRLQRHPIVVGPGDAGNDALQLRLETGLKGRPRPVFGSVELVLVRSVRSTCVRVSLFGRLRRPFGVDGVITRNALNRLKTPKTPKRKYNYTD